MRNGGDKMDRFTIATAILLVLGAFSAWLLWQAGKFSEPIELWRETRSSVWLRKRGIEIKRRGRR